MKEVKPIYGEDYNYHYQFDKKGKRILDLGADYGSTAWHFLQMGALSVVAVEANSAYHIKLVENVAGDSRVRPVFKCIRKAEDFVRLLQGPEDVVKVDIEGAEAALIYVPPEIIRSKKEWAIEVHSQQLDTLIRDFFIGIGFTLTKEHPIIPDPMKMLYFSLAPVVVHNPAAKPDNRRKKNKKAKR